MLKRQQYIVIAVNDNSFKALYRFSIESTLCKYMHK